ncbi:MAG: hypothetical protein WC164_00890 [Patescibacteria group bacterium]
MAYNGRKLNKYIWIPKSKTDLREYREFIKICNILEKNDGFFNDKTIGAEMVKLRAIVDRDNTAISYIEKYKDKKIGDQSYVSNARMLIRIFRWLGFISKDYNKDFSGKYYLTPYGEKLLEFRGPIKKEEIDIFIDAFAVMRFFSQNDDIIYRNYYFRQRPFFNLIRFLDLLGYASHYELALSALVLKDESEEEINEKLEKILRCRKEKNIRWLMSEYGLDCDNKSSVTGIYDGPKVLLSFARQMGLVEEVDLRKKHNESIYNIYKKMYRDSGQISDKSAKKITRITDFGKFFVNKYKNYKLLWFDMIKNNNKNSALVLNCLKDGKVSLSSLANINFDINDLDNDVFILKKNEIILRENFDFDLYRDVPYENRRDVISFVLLMNKNFFNEELIEKSMQVFVKDAEEGACRECYFGKCAFYRNKIDSFGGSDRFSTRVCPENLLSFDKKGVLNLESSGCAGCGLCYFNCPFGAIGLNSDLNFYKKKSNNEGVFINIEEKENLTLSEEKKSFRGNEILLEQVPLLVNNFIKIINSPGKKWDKDKCYVYIRNVFKLFNVDAIYSGSGGMKTRSDVSIVSPFIAVSEVKSPAESPINLKAVRQAVDAAVQSKTKLTMAIGITTHTGAIDQERKYFEVMGMGVLLLEIKYISFFSFLSLFIKFDEHSLARLISNNRGAFGKEELKKYLLSEINILNSDINQDVLEDVINKLFI